MNLGKEALSYACRCLIKLILGELEHIRAEERAEWELSILDPEEVRKRVEQESMKGEWHRSGENIDKILRLLKHVYGEKYVYMVAHHILIQVPNQTKPLEIASAETLFFDHEFLQGLCGEVWRETAVQIATMSQQGRLDYLATFCPDEFCLAKLREAR